MPSDLQRRNQHKTASFHDPAARDLDARHFGAIGIAAVAAHASLRTSTCATPAASATAPILRLGPEAQ